MKIKPMIYLIVPAALLGALLTSAMWRDTRNASPADPESGATQNRPPTGDGGAPARYANGEDGSPAALAERPALDHDYTKLENRLADMRNRRKNQSFDAKTVADAVARKTAWRPINDIPTSLPLRPKERNDGRQFIRFDPLKMESLMPGDEIIVTVGKANPEYRVRIDSVELHDNARISWNGHLLGQNDNYRATFTRGEFLTVGALNTPQGHYTLQSHGDLGWIASSATLSVHAPHVDPIVPHKH